MNREEILNDALSVDARSPAEYPAGKRGPPAAAEYEACRLLDGLCAGHHGKRGGPVGGVGMSIEIPRKVACQIADRYIPGVWGSLRTAWINGFLDYPERGVAKYPKGSPAYLFRQRGKKDRMAYNKKARQT
jgi:hypothetical protein